MLNENNYMNEHLLEVVSLKKHFSVRNKYNRQTNLSVRAVDDVNFYINRGEVLGLVGESGCGKTTTGRVIMQALKATSGEVFFNDKDLSIVDLTQLNRHGLKKIRRNMQMVFQDPYSSLNPRMTLLQTVGEPLIVHDIARGKECRDRVAELLELVGLRPEYMNRYPHSFSGGQRQRIGIARALSTQPDLLICDEAVSALDVSVQAQILNLLRNLKTELGLTFLFIAHDLSVVEHICDRVAVMYVGKIVETSSVEDLYSKPLHPYTEALMSAVPKPDPLNKTVPIILPGEIANPINPPTGCYFHPRCQYCIEKCKQIQPVLTEIRPGRYVSCHRALELDLKGIF